MVTFRPNPTGHAPTLRTAEDSRPVQRRDLVRLEAGGAHLHVRRSRSLVPFSTSNSDGFSPLARRNPLPGLPTGGERVHAIPHPERTQNLDPGPSSDRACCHGSCSSPDVRISLRFHHRPTPICLGACLTPPAAGCVPEGFVPASKVCSSSRSTTSFSRSRRARLRGRLQCSVRRALTFTCASTRIRLASEIHSLVPSPHCAHGPGQTRSRCRPPPS